MPHSQRCVAIFKWDGPLPGFDVESDPERLTALTARAPAEAIVAALRAGGFQTDVDAPYDGEGGWHFTVRIDGVTFGIFTLWTGIGGRTLSPSNWTSSGAFSRRCSASPFSTGGWSRRAAWWTTPWRVCRG